MLVAQLTLQVCVLRVRGLFSLCTVGLAKLMWARVSQYQSSLTVLVNNIWVIKEMVEEKERRKFRVTFLIVIMYPNIKSHCDIV
jgi:hypothetical protein